jgi:hypothetical protein
MENENKQFPDKQLIINANFGDEEEIKRCIKARDLCGFIYDFKRILEEGANRIDNIDDPTGKDEILNIEYERLLSDYNNLLWDAGINLDELYS